MTITSVPIKLSGKTAKKSAKVVSLTQQVKSTRPIVEERQNKVYPFPNLNVSNMFDYLLEINLIELSECRRSQEMNRCEDPNY